MVTSLILKSVDSLIQRCVYKYIHRGEYIHACSLNCTVIQKSIPRCTCTSIYRLGANQVLQLAFCQLLEHCGSLQWTRHILVLFRWERRSNWKAMGFTEASEIIASYGLVGIVGTHAWLQHWTLVWMNQLAKTLFFCRNSEDTIHHIWNKFVHNTEYCCTAS